MSLSRHSILEYLYENAIYVFTGITTTTAKSIYIDDNHVSILLDLIQFSYDSLHLSYIQHEMLSNPYALMIYAYT